MLRKLRERVVRRSCCKSRAMSSEERTAMFAVLDGFWSRLRLRRSVWSLAWPSAVHEAWRISSRRRRTATKPVDRRFHRADLCVRMSFARPAMFKRVQDVQDG